MKRYTQKHKLNINNINFAICLHFSSLGFDKLFYNRDLYTQK